MNRITITRHNVEPLDYERQALYLSQPITVYSGDRIAHCDILIGPGAVFHLHSWPEFAGNTVSWADPSDKTNEWMGVTLLPCKILNAN
jgi:hypothetical protein